MTYKNKLIFLLSIIGALALLYAGSFIFTPESSNRRSASYVWLDKQSASMVDRIVINTYERDIEFINKNQKWVILNDGIEYPARGLRIEDFINVFTQRSMWPVRSSSASTHANFGLESGEADRVAFYSGNSVFLDVLIGYDHVLGNEVSIRRFSQDEVRSGDNRIKTYVSSPVQSWFDLRLFSEAEDVQGITIIKDDGEKQIFSLNNKQWAVTNVFNPDHAIIESYIRTLLSIEGDNFEGILLNRNDFNVSGSVTAEFGNGNIQTAAFSAPDESGRRLAFVYGEYGSEYVYSIPAWQASRLFRNTSDFETQ